MKKALIITYYWPPSGGGGVMRWLKFTKYLPSEGWQPIVFTPSNPDPSATDNSLLKEISPETTVIKLPIWEPYDVYRKITGKKKEEKFKAGYIAEASTKGWKDKLSVFIRGNLMIPDPRKFWVRPAEKFLLAYLKDNPVDVIISTGPPHSMHMIGMRLKEKLNIPWVADFRDPWTNIDFYDRLRLTVWADKKHRSLEKKVLKSADLVTTVSWSWAEDFKGIVPREIDVITNGYDPEDFSNDAAKPDKFFSITHIGSFNKDRNPDAFWQALGSKAASDEGFRKNLKLRFVGQTDQSIFDSLEKNGIKECAEDFGFVDHKRSLEILGQSQVLLLPLNDAPNVSGIIPGKLFEYLATKRPVIVIGPATGDTARIINETAAGKVAGFEDGNGLRQIIDEYYMKFSENKLVIKDSAIKKYSRKELTGQLARAIDRLVK
jgi:glycosyltransferase involved in cell wall biosynthesis